MKAQHLRSPASVKNKLVSLATSMDRDFNGLALEFAIERLVVRLQRNAQLTKHLIFKGGFVMLKAYGSNRATVDLDTSIQSISVEEAEELARAVIQEDCEDGLWMGAIETEKLEHQTKYAGLRLTIRFSFGKPKVDVKRLGKVILDIGVADVITPAPTISKIHPVLGGEPIAWQVYPLETIAAEKLHALINHGSLNSRFKDIYDLTIILPRCDRSVLGRGIKRTFSHRSTPIPASFFEHWQKLDKSVLKRSSGAVFAASGTIPSFAELDRTLSRLLKDFDTLAIT